jgi:hypothetical protein
VRSPFLRQPTEKDERLHKEHLLFLLLLNLFYSQNKPCGL